MLRARHILGAGILAAGVTLATVAVCLDPWEQSDEQTGAYPIAPMHIDAEPSFVDERIRECCSCGSSMSVERAEPIRQGHTAYVPAELTPAWSDPTSLSGHDWAIRSNGMPRLGTTLIYSCEQVSPPTAGFDAWRSPMWDEVRRMLAQTPHVTK